MYSHAEGRDSVASGDNSHAGGYHSEANGYNTFAHGLYAITNYDNGAAFGRHNKTQDTFFVVGNGMLMTKAML